MKVTIIIPNYNGKHFMEACMKSLMRQSFKEFEILIIDNCSIDGSLEYLAKEYPEAEVISLDKNYGFSYAVNVGIKESKTPYIVLLNNDTIVEKYFLEELVNMIEQDKKIFSVSSKMIQLHNPELIDSAGDLYTLLGWGICRGAGRSVRNYPNGDIIFSACAGAAIYRREVFDKIGLFDENHFAYLEDIDIGYRAKINGFENIYCPTAHVYHVGSGTSGSKYNSFKVKLSARNSIYLIYKNMPILQLIINFLPLIIGYLLKYCFFRARGFGKEYKEGIKEGIQTRRKCKKVKFCFMHLPFYIKIEYELILNTFLYAKDWIKRKIYR